ncbi:shikimate kinase [Lachnospiraceae bacterium LCP25S3_G4]
MNELEKYREQLAICDNNIIDALIERNAIIEQIMSYKEAHEMPVLQPEQEANLQEQLKKKLQNNKYQEEICDVFQRIVRNSKRMQARKLFSYNIILIGFMGAGKTTISEYLSTMFAMNIVEMDQIISEREKMSIPDIFATYGEAYFRELETKLLIEVQSNKNTVVSCGGGAALREENVMEMKKNGRVVLLTAHPKTILERVKDSDERPILNGNKNIKFITNLMDQRREKYEAAADIVIHTDDKTVLEICEELITKLSEMEG